jgi:uncharacterized membrane protein YeaQ/YmgE (transglycosylase-associated protein family)
MFLKSLNYKIWGGMLSAVLLGASLCCLAVLISSDVEVRVLNFVVLILGASSGWLAGTLMSPYTTNEEKVFPKYAGTVSAFGSGYLVSKLDKVLGQVLEPANLLVAIPAFRVASGLSAFIIATIITYIFRVYAD